MKTPPKKKGGEAASKEASEKAGIKKEYQKAGFKESEQEGKVKSFAKYRQALFSDLV